ncbi:hypothetical protein LSM04_003646 [Trypanosoma melophagium]|uniref:uncharacterized protein n=1 Tax=Trypanosoma melophagium TaxID=715481 RepID=UPI00351AA815|nr:hypothetical protein LSM04_003646 [Trypanosoma melophagium]
MLGMCVSGMDERNPPELNMLTSPLLHQRGSSQLLDNTKANMKDDSKEMDREKRSEIPLYSPSLSSSRNEDVVPEESKNINNYYSALSIPEDDDDVNVKEHRPEFVIDETLERK